MVHAVAALDAAAPHRNTLRMAAKTTATALICLLIGGIAGYSLRGIHGSSSSAGNTHADMPRPAAHATEARAATGPRQESSAPEKDAQAKSASLGARLDALLADYNHTAAGEEVDTLSPADIQAALALLASRPKSSEVEMLRNLLYRAWAAANPIAAWNAALADPRENSFGSLLGTVAGEMAKTEPTAAIDLALKLGMGSKRASALGRIFNQWSNHDFPGVIAYLNAHPDLPMDTPTIVAFGDENSFAETAKAANLALTINNPQTRRNTITGLLSGWSRRDPAAALEWAQTISNPELKKSAVEAVVNSWSDSDPAAAVAFSETIADSSTRKSALNYTMNNWFRKDPAAAMASLVKPANAELLRSMAFNMASLLGSFTAQERAGLLAQIPEGEAKQRIYQGLSYSQISRGQYTQALEMLSLLPDSSERDSAVRELGERWAVADLATAAAWLKVQPDSSDRDLAVTGYVRTLSRSDPAAAAQWAATIPDDGLRKPALQEIAGRWLAAEPGKAEAWLAGLADLSDAEKKRVRDDAARAAGNPNYYYGGRVTKRR